LTTRFLVAQKKVKIPTIVVWERFLLLLLLMLTLLDLMIILLTSLSLSFTRRVGSQIFKAWRSFLDELEQQSKQIRTNAEHLEQLCSERMMQLYQDKRKLRKQYTDDHAKIASQFAHVSNQHDSRECQKFFTHNEMPECAFPLSCASPFCAVCRWRSSRDLFIWMESKIDDLWTLLHRENCSEEDDQDEEEEVNDDAAIFKERKLETHVSLLARRFRI